MNEIEIYFAETGAPDFVVPLNPAVKVLAGDKARQYIETSIRWINTHADNPTFDTYWDALVLYYKKVKKVRAVLKRHKKN